MSKKDDEIQALTNEVETMKARVNNLEEENKQVRLRARGLDKKLKKVQKEKEDTQKLKENEIDGMKDRIITLGKQAEKVLDAKNKEIENLAGMVKERSFAIKSSQPIDILSHTVIHGAILSSESISLGDNVLVDGHVDSGGSITIGAQSTVKGVVRGKGDIDIGIESEIQGDIESGSDIVLDGDTRVHSIRSEGNVDLGEKCRSTKIIARGDVIIGNGASIELGIRYGGSVSIGKQTSVKGTIEYIEDSSDDDELFEGLGAPSEQEIVEEEEDFEEEEEAPPTPKKKLTPKKQKPVVEEDEIDCPVCGTPISANTKKCPGCGTIVKHRESNRKPREKDVKVPSKIQKRSARK